MIFDLYQDGQTTKRVMAVNENDVIVLEDQTFIFNIDFENEVGDILIEDILSLDNSYSKQDLEESHSHGWVSRERLDDLSPEINYPSGLDYEGKEEFSFNIWYNKLNR